MTVATPLALRWERAQQIDRSKIQDVGRGWFRVPSSQGASSYRVHVDFDAAGKLVAASCSCPDFERPTTVMGTPLLHGTVKVCKHILSASLKAKDTGQHAPTFESGRNGQDKPDSTHGTAGIAKPAEVSASPLSTAGQPILDEECQEWVLTASDRVHYCGATFAQCIQQFHEALHYQADHARKNARSTEDLSECQAPSDGTPLLQAAPTEEVPRAVGVSMSDNRRQALSRARGIANQSRPPLGTTYRLYGVAQGDVLDWSDQGLFLAVVAVTSETLFAHGVLQDDPWGTFRDIRMGANTMHVRLQNGWLTKVRDLHR